jgi:hypothetical protein
LVEGEPFDLQAPTSQAISRIAGVRYQFARPWEFSETTALTRFVQIAPDTGVDPTARFEHWYTIYISSEILQRGEWRPTPDGYVNVEVERLGVADWASNTLRYAGNPAATDSLDSFSGEE